MWHEDNQYIKEAINTWRIGEKTYCLIESNKGFTSEYMVRVVPDGFDDGEGFWLNGGQTWETESGAAWSILTALHEELR